MRKYPAIVHMTPHWLRFLREVSAETKDGWVPARPIPYYGGFRRFRAAWLVFTGKADALVWPGGQ
jgi:hypothetical protein